MKSGILSLAALAGLFVLPASTQAQVVSRYYGRPYYTNTTNYKGLNQQIYNQRLHNMNALRYGQNHYFPYNNINHNAYNRGYNYNSYNNGLLHRGYNRSLAPNLYNNYNGYGRSGIYYNTPGFGFRFSL